MKVWIYAICKNEAQFADRWMDSMQEADGITVLDTGSADQTVEILRSRGAEVFCESISPWRFDIARNRSLSLVPPDVDLCVCTDLDEVFRPGWRMEAERAWTDGVNQLRYRYVWSFFPDGSPDHVFFIEKIHARTGFQWVGAVHEVLKSKSACMATAEGILLEHYPDAEKSRGQYLPLLELAVKEEPENDRNCHYLGREYMFHRRWNEAIRVLKHHLQMKSATWKDERCASMRYIARCYRELNSSLEETWLLRAAAEAPWLREPWVELAECWMRKEFWYGVSAASGRALEITERSDSYITEGRCWGSLPYDLLSLGLYYSGSFEEALTAAEEALRLSPDDLRIRKNREFMQEKIKR